MYLKEYYHAHPSVLKFTDLLNSSKIVLMHLCIFIMQWYTEEILFHSANLQLIRMYSFVLLYVDVASSVRTNKDWHM